MSSMSTSTSSAFVFLPILFFLIYVISIGLGIYCLVLFIKFARRAIKALDIYLEEKKRS
jgi:ABC-type antimicrobial peptide transport system permease subunit